MARQIKLEFWKGYSKRVIEGFTDYTRNQKLRRLFVQSETYKKLLEPHVKNIHTHKFDFDAPDADRAYAIIDHWVPDEIFEKSNNEIIGYLNANGDNSIVPSKNTDWY